MGKEKFSDQQYSTWAGGGERGGMEEEGGVGTKAREKTN